MSDDQCPATTQTGFGVVRCQLPMGHPNPEDHTNEQYRWARARCAATTFVNNDVGMVACSLREGHSGDHIENDTGRALYWPDLPPVAPDPGPVTDRATHHYGSKQLAGANRDDLIRNLFERVEQLEQTSANAGAVDHMFGSTNRSVERLASGLGEIERRMTALEGAVSHQGGSDLSALQSSLMNHTNRAMTDLAMGFQERHQEIGARLKAMWDVLAAMAPIIDSLKPAPLKAICGAPALHGPDVCDLDAGHDGRHYCGTSTWPNQSAATCGATHPVESGRTCVRPRGHTAAHKSSSRGDVRLVWNDEPVPDHQEERASGSPAPARCPSQFREGQCLGYTGHDGGCSAVPHAAGNQLEESAEFAGSTYDRSSDGTPLEEPVQRMENNGPWDPDAEEGWKPLGYTTDGL